MSPPSSSGPRGSLGADIEQVDRASAAWLAAAVELDAIARRLRERLRSVEASRAWTGRDAARLLDGMGRLLPSLGEISGALVRGSRALAAHAAEQRRASAPAPAVAVERWSRAGDGIAVQRVGPHGAGTVVVVVPGVGSDVGDAQRLADDAVRVHARAWVRHGLDDVAIISWLGYDPPDTVPGGLDPRPAARGAAALGDDVRRWRGGGAERVVLVGHSYGALVAGRAAAGGTADPAAGGSRRRDGQVDALVQLGAPGAGPPGPTAWTVLRDPALDWVAARAPGDPIVLASPWLVDVHGPDPVLLTGRLATTTRGHGGYLHDPAVLDAIARIAGRRGPAG